MCHFTGMSGRHNMQRKIEESDVSGLKYFDKLAPLLQRVPPVYSSSLILLPGMRVFS